MRKFNRNGQGQFTLSSFEKLRFFGGSYCTKRKYRVRRPLSTKEPVHLVLRSKQAKGPWSFLLKKNRKEISKMIIRIGDKWGVQILQFANVGNHIHLLIRIKNLRTYKPFICAVTGGITALVTAGQALKEKFWDYRPYSRIIYGLKGYLNVRDYIEINQYEGGGTPRDFAVVLVKGGLAVDTG